MTKSAVFIFLFLLTVSSVIYGQEISKQYRLWYKQPAAYFEEALVLGNGKMGATVFGGMETDSIYLNDITLWTGQPVNPDMNPQAHIYIPAIRKALFEEKYHEADSLNRFVQGSFSQSYAPLGTLYMDFKHDGEISAYSRELNINNAMAKVSYQSGGVRFIREYFVSHPDQLLIIRLRADKPGMLNGVIRFDSKLKHSSISAGGMLISKGYAPYHAEPNYRGNISEAIRFDENKGTRFITLIRPEKNLKQEQGLINEEGSAIRISNATDVMLLISIATSFNGYDKDPVIQGRDYEKEAENIHSKVKSKSFENLLNRHKKDYQSFFNRISFQLEEKDTVSFPTDQRLMRYAAGETDRSLEEMYFQFGRYLMISSSRTPGVPANLQGLWNQHMRPPWSSNYTMNINLEENYWIAETGNLSEMHKPLMGFIKNLSATGKITARNFYGINRGWTACHNSDIWAMSNPVGDFGKGQPVWANWNMAGAWLSTHLWDHYLFTKDEKFLRTTAYPLMKGAAEFCLDWLIEDKNGKLVTAPSTSPENIYLLPDNTRGATLYGAAADIGMIKELFLITARASEILGGDEVFRNEMRAAMERLSPYKIGKKGNLQEWYHDWEDNEPEHRHQTHLYGLFPGHHISPSLSPELAEACKVSLNIKGDISTGWSQGWRINLWARLKDGNRAYKLYRTLLTYVDPSGRNTNYSGGGGTYPNLLDAHPPFQIDGNFGGAAGVLEMLVYSNEQMIELLPALPDAWSSGSIKGVKARGGFEIDMEWKDKKIIHCIVRSEKGGSTQLAYNGIKKNIRLKAGKRLKIRW